LRGARAKFARARSARWCMERSRSIALRRIDPATSLRCAGRAALHAFAPQRMRGQDFVNRTERCEPRLVRSA
jgi:hypothetical protein